MPANALKFDLRDVLDELGGRWVGPGEPPERRVRGVSTDSRSIAEGELFFALQGEHFDGHDFVLQAVARGAAACVIRGDRQSTCAGPLVVVDDPLDALERLADRHRKRLSAEVTAITGSVGKTTTKEFLLSLLSVRHRVRAAPRSFNNRLGVALTLLSADRRTEHLVVELGTSARGEIAHLSRLVRPERAVITEVAAAHLSGLGGIEGVIAAKEEILEGLSSGGVAYLNAALPGFDRIASRAPGEVRSFGWESGDYAVRRCRSVALAGGEGDPSAGPRLGYIFEVDGEELEIPLPGRHNVLNAVAAVAVARDAGLSWEEVRVGLRRLRLPPRRLEIESAGGILLIDDAYNANPGSVASAIETLEEVPGGGGRKVLVLGDMLELGEESVRFHEEAGRRVAGGVIDVLVTLGCESRHAGAACVEELRRRGGRPGEVRHFERPADACDYLTRLLGPGDQVLVKGSNRSGAGAVAAELRAQVRTRASEALPGAQRSPEVS